MFPLPVLLTVAAAVLICSIRDHWLAYCTERYVLIGDYWLRATGQPQSVAVEMAEFWPKSTMRLELWRWDFSRYVVYQDHLSDSMTFAVKACLRRELTLEEFYRRPDDPLFQADTPVTSESSPNGGAS